jgi:hypothetical protein
MKRLLTTLAATGLLSLTAACGPPPPVATFGGAWWDAITRAVQQVIGTAPSNPSIDCQVVIFDQSVRAVDFEAVWTPVRATPDIYTWIQACFFPGYHHVFTTTKASGYPNPQPPDPNKMAVCWADASFAPDGDMKFTCHFDRNSKTAWVQSLATSKDGTMWVGW